MRDVSDMELVREYARLNSEAAFAELVQRHINLVYSVALRQTGIATQAEEITQAVFIILARKAGGLRADTILEGWLYETTRLVSLSFLRGEYRRQFREQEAYMQSQLHESGSDLAWQQLSPLLDEAMAHLGKKDRDAVILRFFKENSIRNVAASLQVNESAAQRRILRALEKLRKFFTKRGVSSTTAVIAGAISANSVQAAPVALAKSVTAVAVAKGAAASGSILTLIKGALKIMAWTKAKTAVVVGVVVLFAAGTTTMVVKRVHNQATVFSPTDSAKVDDSFFFPDSGKLFKLPPTILIFRQSHFTQSRGSMTATKSGFIQKPECRLMGAGQSLSEVLAMLYQISAVRIILPPDSPTGRFDFMVTLPATSEVQQCKRLQDEITRQIGLAGRKESREVNALLLQVKTTEAPGLSPHVAKDDSNSTEFKSGKTYCKGQTMGMLAYFTEYAFKQVVIDRTGLKGRFDYVLDDAVFNGKISHKAAEKYLLDQFGLELMPSREPIEMLVVEKAQ